MSNLSSRLEARISPDLHQLVKRAASLQGRSVSDFVVSAVQDAARLAIEQADLFRFSLADQQLLFDVLSSPPSPSPALLRAADRHSKLINP